MSKHLLQTESKSVLYVDSDLHEESQISELLESLFKKVIQIKKHQDATEIYREELPDLVIYSIEEVDVHAIKLIKQIRGLNYHTPIIVISECYDHSTLLAITNLSVDAYLYQPLDMGMFTNAILRSTKRNLQSSKLIVLDKDLTFNISTQELYLFDSVVTLGVKERLLLLLLIENPYKTITKEEIATKIWPMDSISDSAIKKIIFRIRQKLDSDLIVSVRGVGYRLETKMSKTVEQALKAA